MAFSRLVFSVIFLSVSCYASNVPAYLWGDLAKTSTKANPLNTVSGEEFMGLLQEEFGGNYFTVVFSDETLSPEDLSAKNADGTSFPFLQKNLISSVYLPSVENPLSVIENIVNPNEVGRITKTEDGVTEEIQSDDVKFLIVSLKDAKEGESRADLLRRHNDFMEKTYLKLKENQEKVVAIYTAENPSWSIPDFHSRVRRQAETSNNTNASNSVEYVFGELRMYVKSIDVKEGNTTVSFNGTITGTTEVTNATLMNTTLKYGDNSCVLNMHRYAGYWFIDSISIESTLENERTLYPTTEVFAIEGFSYRCAQTITFNTRNSTRAVTFNDIQVQPFFASNVTEFGDTFDCVGFFSAPIWAGLMVTFLLLAITFYGIMMMMDIRTMDRFDDPKGKTITINTTE